MSHPTAQVALVQLMKPDRTWTNVGFLRHRNEITRFEYVPSYWEIPNRPVLGQIFEEHGRNWTPSQRVAVPTWFSHLLPEGYLRHAVADAIRTKPLREFPMLMRLGENDLPGAVRVIASDEEDAESIDETGFQVHEHEDDSEEAVLKFSLAGVQPKFSVLLDPERGLTIPARGQVGDFIVKLPDGRPGFEQVPEAELAGLKLAEAVGIPVPDAFLVNLAGISGLPRWAKSAKGNALAIRRFDRMPDGRRIHAEVLAQVLDVPTANERLKYRRANFETVASIVNSLAGTEAMLDVIDRIVINVLIGNGDAHLKNWALTYPDGSSAALSPAFDIVPTVLFINDDDLGMKLNGSRSFVSITRKSFDRIASRLGIGEDEVRDRVDRAVDLVESNWSVLRQWLNAERFALLTDRRNRLPLFRFNRTS